MRRHARRAMGQNHRLTGRRIDSESLSCALRVRLPRQGVQGLRMALSASQHFDKLAALRVATNRATFHAVNRAHAHSDTCRQGHPPSDTPVGYLRPALSLYQGLYQPSGLGEESPHKTGGVAKTPKTRDNTNTPQVVGARRGDNMGIEWYARYWVYDEDDQLATFVLDTSNSLDYLREKYENVAIWDDKDGEWV